MDKFLIIDGNSIANRAFYALPFLSNHEGKPSGAVFGFVNILLKVIQEEKPTHVLVAFDHARKTFRNNLYSEYKMQRKPTPEELLCQFPIIKNMLKTMGIKVIESEGIEADDIIGTVTNLFHGEKFVLSGDKDLLQLIDDSTCIWLTKRGVSEVDKVDGKRLNELYGLQPWQIIELKALMGDTSDNIPGVSGIGEKTALSLLDKYDSVYGVYSNIENISGKLKEKLINDKENAYLSQKLATIKRDCEIQFNIDECKLVFPFDSDVYEFFREWDFTSLVKNQSLFSNDKLIEESDKIETLTLDLNILKQISETRLDCFCYDFHTLQFLFNNTIYTLDSNYGMFDNNLTIEEICLMLKSIFEDENIVKITLNSKEDMHLLDRYNIKLNNFYDLSIAEYILDAGLKNSKIVPLEKYKSYMENTKAEIDKHKLNFVYDKIEKPLVEILFNMEKNGFKLNEAKLDLLSEEFEEKIENLKKQIYFDAGEEFNINSPKQVAYILYDKLGIESYNNKKKSTSVDVLDELRYIPIVNNILIYRKYSKIKNTYIDVYKTLCTNSNNIIHTTFNQTLTSTGRLSSSEPNLQNIPTRDDEGKTLRKIFISKFEGGKIISADYNQIELRLLADMSGEEQLIESYCNGDDVHRNTASTIFNVPFDNVTDNQRREAKAVNFGIIYGISDYGLSQNIKSTRAKAKEYIDSYFTRFPKVKLFMDSNVQFASEHGYAITKFGRIRKIPEIASSKYLTRTFGERVAMNMPLQGTASDIIKLAMIKVNNELSRLNLKSQLILQIHDELIIDTYPGEEEDVLKILKQEMESVIKLKVPLIVSIGIGDSLFDCK